MFKFSIYLNKRGLFPRDRKLALWFEAERKKIMQRGVQVGAMLAVVLVPVFSVLDYYLKGAHFHTFLQLRLSVIVLSLVIYMLARGRIGKRMPYALGALLTLLVGGSIALMCFLDQGPSDPYYAGINLPILAFGILFPMTFMEGLAVGVMTWLLYFIPQLINLASGQVAIFINNNFFMVSTIVISLIASQFHLHSRRREWHARFKLEKAHEKIRRHSRELEQKVRERTQKLIQSERLAVVGQLAGGIAHDFNNHLTGILGMSEMLIYTKDLPESLKPDIVNIRNAGLRATELVKQLLAFSRQQRLDPKVLNLNEIVQDAQKLLRRLIGEDIELIIQTDPDIRAVKVDPVQAEQIILNLAVNARDAMPGGGKLIIETKNVRLEKPYLGARQLSVPCGNYVMLVVSDNGSGMEEEIRQKIFEPFFTTKIYGKGTGLGLSTVYGIVKQTHGDILVYSERDVGTTFKIFLPAVEEKVEFQPRPEIRILPKGSETILLVEDEETIRNLTARLLRQQGYRVVQAREGFEALEKANAVKGRIHLLMTDVVMPHMNGRELAEKIRKDKTGIKVLYFSGYTDAFIQKKGIITKDSVFLQKPFTFEALSFKVREAIDDHSEKMNN
ncbi:response regulator [bacterium]|nr:response regulator [bacterium]